MKRLFKRLICFILGHNLTVYTKTYDNGHKHVTLKCNNCDYLNIEYSDISVMFMSTLEKYKKEMTANTLNHNLLLRTLKN